MTLHDRRLAQRRVFLQQTIARQRSELKKDLTLAGVYAFELGQSLTKAKARLQLLMAGLAAAMIVLRLRKGRLGKAARTLLWLPVLRAAIPRVWARRTG